MIEQPPTQRLVEFRIEDAQKRMQFQQDYTLDGLKTLILLEGGAIIGLLTYAGHSPAGLVASKLGAAILFYVGALVAAVLAYLMAYGSQGELGDDSVLEAYRLLGIEAKSPKTQADCQRNGTWFVWGAILLCLLSLGGFILGSLSALAAVSANGSMITEERRSSSSATEGLSASLAVCGPWPKSFRGRSSRTRIIGEHEV